MRETFYILVALQILLGLYSLWEGARWLQMVRRRLASHPGFYAPRVALICPCKGVEPGLEQNLAALTDFDYPSYEVFFTLASAGDPAYAVLRRATERSKRPVHILVASPPEGCGEKVNNLRAAVEQLPAEFEVLVFTDSDGRPAHHWLRHLVAPLADARLGAATTMRWYLPNRGGFWSALAAAWNAPIATYLGEHRNNFCWGGGTAIRRQVFDQVHALEYWRGSVSDDYSLTRGLRAAGRRIHFVPECLVPTLHDVDLHGLLEFTNRQIVITRVYAPQLWALAGLAHLLYSGTVGLGLVGVLAGMLGGQTALHIFLLTLTPPLLAALRGYLRLAAVLDLLPAWKQKLLAYGWAWTLLAAMVPLLYSWNSLMAVFTRRIVWRGVHYLLISPSQTRILSS
ncbi:MAG: glycosyltransferase [Acidobacteria bacterium]|nr:glycosyltransferase [Acidobacteriota bacterium]